MSTTQPCSYHLQGCVWEACLAGIAVTCYLAVFRAVVDTAIDMRVWQEDDPWEHVKMNKTTTQTAVGFQSYSPAVLCTVSQILRATCSI